MIEPELEELAALLPEFVEAAPESLLLPPSLFDEPSELFAEMSFPPLSFDPPSFELLSDPLSFELPDDGALLRPA